MAYEQKDMTGSLFKNNRKERDTQPAYTGSVTLNGEQYWLSAWLKKDKHSETYMSLALKPKEERREEPAPRQQSASNGRAPSPSPIDDDIPFDR